MGGNSVGESVPTSALNDEQFEAQMREFSRRLELGCNIMLKQHAKKLRPNYDNNWVVSLKTQLKVVD